MWLLDPLLRQSLTVYLLAGLELMEVPLPLRPKCWDSRYHFLLMPYFGGRGKEFFEVCGENVVFFLGGADLDLATLLSC